jgi:histone-lysine N-methyltransferase SETMAR
MTFTAKFFIDNVLPDIVAAKPPCRPHRRLIVHMDNASPHRAVSTARKLEKDGIVASPCPAFSPNLEPSDFFIFGPLKGQPAGCTFKSAEEVCDRTSAIPLVKGETVFRKREERLPQRININGVDVHSTATWGNR